MTMISARRTFVLAGAALVSIVCAGSATLAQQAPAVKRTVLLQHDAPTPGYVEVMVRVDFPPGSREGRHTHPGLAIVHVEEGTMMLDYDGKMTTYKAGDSFAVDPGKVHEGINNSGAPVRAIAAFVVEKGKPLTTQVTATH